MHCHDDLMMIVITTHLVVIVLEHQIDAPVLTIDDHSCYGVRIAGAIHSFEWDRATLCGANSLAQAL